VTVYPASVSGRPLPGSRRHGEPSLPLWLGPTLLPFGWTAWASFAYAGVRTRSRRLLWTAGVYAVVAAASVGLTGIVGVGAGDAGNGIAEDVGTVLGLLTWAVGIVHGLRIRHDVERRIELRRTTDDALLERRHARELAATQPAAARAIGIGRPDLPDGHHAGLVDLNSAPAEAIATLTGVDIAVAEQIVAMREELGGFSSVEDLGSTLDLAGDVVERLRERALLVPRPG
jgi:competence ComEA-like helix-hairpin-helix protein